MPFLPANQMMDSLNRINEKHSKTQLIHYYITLQLPKQTNSLIGLLFADLIYLVEQLTHSKLQIRKFIFGSNLLIVIGTFTHLYT